MRELHVFIPYATCLNTVVSPSSLESTVTLGASVIKVTISITSSTATRRDNSRSAIRFDADLDWRQRHNFLKFEIPLNINSPEALFDAAFGNVSRPTHRNSNVELAKFEVCGHKVPYRSSRTVGYCPDRGYPSIVC